MSYSIKITLKKAEVDYDPGASKLFGAPAVPGAWEERFDEDIIFFGQIRLSDIAEYDIENKLPHSGYLYLFLDTAFYPYRAWVEHYDGEPDTAIEDFNELDPEFAHLSREYLMSFSTAEDDYDGTKLFGIPSMADDENQELLLQFDPLDNETGFLSEIDGYAYFFFGEGKDRISDAAFEINRS